MRQSIPFAISPVSSCQAKSQPLLEPSATAVTTTSQTMDPLASESDRYRDALRFLYERINYERLAVGSTSRYPVPIASRDRVDAIAEPSAVPVRRLAPAKCAADSHCGDQGEGIGSRNDRHGADRLRLADGPVHLTPSASTGGAISDRRRPCSPADLISLVERVESASRQVERSSGGPSFFELTTAMAMLHFDTSRL